MKILYKSESESLHTFIQKCKHKGHLRGKYCYCGRLDPMASGKMLFLENKECSKMPKYLKCMKEYEFEIGLGISTDTDDILGIIDEINFETNNTFDYSNILDKELDKLILQTKQNYHKFSAHKINYNNNRISLTDISKDKKIISDIIPTKFCKVYSIKKLNKKIVNLHYYLDVIINKIEKLYDPNDYYRKNRILKRWKDFRSTLNNYSEINITIYKYKIIVSSGFYVRQLIADLKKNCNFPLIGFNIKRTQIFKDGCFIVNK